MRNFCCTLGLLLLFSSLNNQAFVVTTDQNNQFNLTNSQGGSYGFDASGNPLVDNPSAGTIVVGNHKNVNLFSRINGKPSATTFNGLPVPRVNATPVYTGSDLDNVLLYQNENAVDSYWYRVDVYAVVVAAATAGTLQVKLEYQDKAQVQTQPNVLESALDLTSIGNHQTGYICIPMHAAHGIFRYIDGTGVTGSPQVQVNFLVTEF